MPQSKTPLQFFAAIATSFLLTQSARAQYPIKITLTLPEVEKAALAHSHVIAAAKAESEAAQSGAAAQYSFILPRLTLEGSWGYDTAIPEAKLGTLNVPFGTHVNTAIGPALDYTLWDEGALYRSWKSQKAQAQSAAAQERLARRQTLLSARLAFFQAQLASDQTKLLADSLSLSLAQYKDIFTRYHGGTSSKIDSLTSHQDVLLRESEFRQAQVNLASSLREIFTLMGKDQSFDLTRPVAADIADNLPKETSAPTAFVEIESPTGEQRPSFVTTPNSQHPEIRAYAMLEESSKLAAKAEAAGAWPKIQLSARSYYYYPDVMIDINPTYLYQNTVGLTASVPLFEGGKSAEKSKQEMEIAKAAHHRKEEAAENLGRDYLKAKDQLTELYDQEKLDIQSVKETSELARLVYSAYRAGHTTIVEVQDADLRSLQAGIEAARTQAQIRIQIATLNYISGDPDE